jgi:hypothetical protein
MKYYRLIQSNFIKELLELSTALQIYIHLEILADQVKETTNSMVKACGDAVRKQLDVADINQQVKEAPAAKSASRAGVRRVNEPGAMDSSSKIWTDVLWKRMEVLTDEMYKQCIKVLPIFLII